MCGFNERCPFKIIGGFTMKRFLVFSLVFCLSFISICSPCYAKEKEEDVEYHFEIKRYQSFPEKYQKAVQLADIYANFVHH